MKYCFNFREEGLSEVCDLIEEAKDVRMDEEKSELSRSFLKKIEELEEENTELTIDQLEKIPECPVNILFTNSLNALFIS